VKNEGFLTLRHNIYIFRYFLFSKTKILLPFRGQALLFDAKYCFYSCFIHETQFSCCHLEWISSKRIILFLFGVFRDDVILTYSVDGQSHVSCFHDSGRGTTSDFGGRCQEILLSNDVRPLTISDHYFMN